MMADDMQDICSNHLSESKGPWITNLTDKQLGELTAWIRMRPIMILDKRYAVEDDGILCRKEREHSEEEKDAQTKALRRTYGWIPWKQDRKVHPGVQVQDGHAQLAWVGPTCIHLCMAEGQCEHGLDDRSFLEHSAVHQGRQGQGAQLQGQVLAGDAH
eukprot:9849509-Heterocapsa_arctica.AAC.1